MIYRHSSQQEFTKSAGALFVALFSILITVILIRMLNQAAEGSLPTNTVLKLIGFGALTHFSIVMILSVFIAVLLVLSRYYQDSEMVVWFSCGLPLKAFIRPVLTFGLPIVALIAVMSLYIEPWAYSRNAVYQAKIQSRDDSTRVAPGVFRESSDGKYVLFVDNGGDVNTRLDNIFFSQPQDTNQVDIIVADQGNFYLNAKNERWLKLENGRRYQGNFGTKSFQVTHFSSYDTVVEASTKAEVQLRRRAYPTSALLQMENTTGVSNEFQLKQIQYRNRSNLGELASRISMPIAMFMLLLLAIPLSFVNPRVGRGMNLIFAALIYTIYSNAINIFQGWIAEGKLSLILGIILPHLLAFACFLLLMYQRTAGIPFWRRHKS